MHRDFWIELWREGRLGFHLAEPNPRLVAHHAFLANDARILVPLSGKSVDLAYLAQRGHEVVGIELAERAVVDFFDERKVVPEVRVIGTGGTAKLYEAGPLAIVASDFFEVQREDLGSVGAVYDRAALIALPPEVRPRYVEHLRSLVGPSARILLVTLAFDAGGGPPFSVSEAEVRALYPDAEIERLADVDITNESPNLRARGASKVSEMVFGITLPSQA